MIPKKKSKLFIVRRRGLNSSIADTVQTKKKNGRSSHDQLWLVLSVGLLGLSEPKQPEKRRLFVRLSTTKWFSSIAGTGDSIRSEEWRLSLFRFPQFLLIAPAGGYIRNESTHTSMLSELS